MAELNTGYNDEKAMEEPKFTPKYGVFKAKIVEVLPAKGEEFDVKTSSNGKPHYTARYIFEFKDAEGEVQKKSAFIPCIGLWFPPLTKQLLAATDTDDEDGRSELMTNTDALVGAMVKIVIGSRKKGEYGNREEFEGFEVGEYNDKKYIANEINEIHPATAKPKLDMEAEASLRERFRDSGGATTKTDQQVDEAFGKEDGDF